MGAKSQRTPYGRPKKAGPAAPHAGRSLGGDPIAMPRNAAQRAAERLFPATDWMFLMGAAGTGKTHQAMKMAVDALLGRVKLPFQVRKIILARPTVEAGPRQGFLPGTSDEKMAPWLLPIYDVLRNITAVKPADLAKVIEVCPFQYMRGRTFDDCVVVIDECQNCSFDLLELAYTRLGERGRMIFCGSYTQSDLPHDQRDLEYFVDAIHGSAGSEVVYFDESMILRNPRMAGGLRALGAGRARMAADRKSAATGLTGRRGRVA